MAAPRKKKAASGTSAAPRKTVATPKRETTGEKKYEAIQFPVSGGTRALCRKAAELEGMTVNEWMRAALFERAERTFAEHGVEYPMPPVHPERPKPLPLRRRR